MSAKLCALCGCTCWIGLHLPMLAGTNDNEIDEPIDGLARLMPLFEQ